MAFCQSCGSQVDGRFCAKCGAGVGGAAAVSGTPAGYTGSTPQAGGLTDNIASALCYVLGLVTGIVFLVLAPYNQNKQIRFHAFQAIFVHVALLIFFMAIMPVLGFMLGHMIWFFAPIVSIGSVLLWVWLIWKAYNNERFKVPILGDLAEKQA
jgi:uncharacterized membrane protein